MDCRRSTRLLSEARERPLTEKEREDLRRHLEICPACRNCERQFETLRRGLRKLIEP